MVKMRRGKTSACAVFLTLCAATPSMATEWVADFSNWSGQDASAVSGYTDLEGGNSRTFSVQPSADYANVPAGWLVQGMRGGVPGTAVFYNAPGDGKGGRARFATLLPSTMDGDGGVSFAWTARYGNYAISRGPVELAITTHGGPGGSTSVNEFNIYLRVQAGTLLSIRKDSGGAYPNLGDLTIPSVADDRFHQWSCAVITRGTSAHWKLWVDGTFLRFPGVLGAHTFDPGDGPQQFSFQTPNENFNGPTGSASSSPYIGLGDMGGTLDQWDFEFDCVAYRDEGMSDNFTCGAPAQSCALAVSPTDSQSVAAIKNGEPSVPSLAFVVANSGADWVGYTAAETDEAGNPVEYTWISLDKPAGGPIPAGSSEVVRVVVTDTNLPAGTYTAYVTFRNNCSPPLNYTRRIDLTITDCAAAIYPPAEVARSVIEGSMGALPDALFTITNTGTHGLTCDVNMEGGCSWLKLDKPVVGPLDHGQSNTVRASIDSTGLSVGSHTCTLRFAHSRTNCTNSVPDQFRTVTVQVFHAGSAFDQLNAEFTEFLGTDRTASSPLVSTDPTDLVTRRFTLSSNSVVDDLGSGWLVQGHSDQAPTTARFWNPLDGKTGRARLIAPQGFGPLYDPLKGLAVAWRMKLGDYAIVRGPIEISFAATPGPLPTKFDSTTIPQGMTFNAYVLIEYGRAVSILRNGGPKYEGIDTLLLPASVANEYHQWTAGVCYNPEDGRAYWNLWLDGNQLMFAGNSADGSAGSPVGPGGLVFSFRTWANDTGHDPFVAIGDMGVPYPDYWDMEFDWVRLVSWSQPGCPFWDGSGTIGRPLCSRPFADLDGDGDVDQVDFGIFQQCYMGAAEQSLGSVYCGCLDRSSDGVINRDDLEAFLKCATTSGSAVPWTPSFECP